MHPCPVIYRLCDPNKVDVVDALVAGRKIIEDDNVSIEVNYRLSKEQAACVVQKIVQIIFLL